MSIMGNSIPGFVVASPILPGRIEAWRRFCQELMGARRSEYEASRRRLGITCERVWLVRLNRIAFALLYIEVSQPETALDTLVNSPQPFDLWFRRQLHEFHGLDLTLPPMGQTVEMVYEWRVNDDFEV